MRGRDLDVKRGVERNEVHGRAQEFAVSRSAGEMSHRRDGLGGIPRAGRGVEKRTPQANSL